MKGVDVVAETAEGPTMKPVHLPNPFACAYGFAAAGCGVGSLVGMAIGPWIYPPFPEGMGTMHEQTLVSYGGVFLGSVVGIPIGAVVGPLYAVLVRRSRLRRAARA